MKKSKIQEYEEQVLLDTVIGERFKTEREGYDNVDGVDRWALDLFNEEGGC